MRPPRRPGGRGPLYYGWVIVGALAVTETVSYGVLMYAFPVVLSAMEADLQWSQQRLTGAYSLAALAAGIFAIPVGRWIDRHGPRAVMTAGSGAATLLLVAWSQVERPSTYYAIWLGLGICMATLFYEPAFTVVTQWFRRDRARALTLVTLAGGLASTIFVPLTAQLLEVGGWRYAVLCLALVLGALTIVPHAVVLRRRPESQGSRADGDRLTLPRMRSGPHFASPRPASDPTLRSAVASRSFRWIAAAFFLSTLANVAVAIHLIPMLLERGYSIAGAGVALAALGAMKLPGRLLAAPLAARFPMHAVAGGVFLVQAVGLLALMSIGGGPGVWILVALFGVGDGAGAPARALLIGERFGSSAYGAISGALAFLLAIARAAAPFGASVVFSITGGYDAVLGLLLALTVLAAASVAAAGWERPPSTGSAAGRGPTTAPACKAPGPPRPRPCVLFEDEPSTGCRLIQVGQSLDPGADNDGYIQERNGRHSRSDPAGPPRDSWRSHTLLVLLVSEAGGLLRAFREVLLLRDGCRLWGVYGVRAVRRGRCDHWPRSLRARCRGRPPRSFGVRLPIGS